MCQSEKATQWQINLNQWKRSFSELGKLHESVKEMNENQSVIYVRRMRSISDQSQNVSTSVIYTNLQFRLNNKCYQNVNNTNQWLRIKLLMCPTNDLGPSVKYINLNSIKMVIHHQQETFTARHQQGEHLLLKNPNIKNNGILVSF